MTERVPTMTAEVFEQYAQQPENINRRLEYAPYVDEGIIEVVSDNYSSLVGGIIFLLVGNLVMSKKLGWMFPADAGFMVGEARYMPDVAYISYERQPEPYHGAWNPNAPDLAVEVLSPTDKPFLVRAKLATYLAAGCNVWIVDPIEKRVEVYYQRQAAYALGVDDTLTGGTVLPGFSVAVKDFFPGTANTEEEA